MILPSDLNGCQWQLVSHLHLSRGAHDYVYQCLEHPLLQVQHTHRRGEPRRSRLFVGDVEVPWRDLAQAADLLNAAQSSAAGNAA